MVDRMALLESTIVKLVTANNTLTTELEQHQNTHIQMMTNQAAIADRLEVIMSNQEVMVNNQYTTHEQQINTLELLGATIEEEAPQQTTTTTTLVVKLPPKPVIIPQQNEESTISLLETPTSEELDNTWIEVKPKAYRKQKGNGKSTKQKQHPLHEQLSQRQQKASRHNAMRQHKAAPLKPMPSTSNKPKTTKQKRIGVISNSLLRLAHITDGQSYQCYINGGATYNQLQQALELMDPITQLIIIGGTVEARNNMKPYNIIKNLKDLLEVAMEKAYDVKVVGIPKATNNKYNNNYNNVVEHINKQIQATCHQYQASYIPTNNIFDNGSFADDGYHLNNRGTKQLLQQIGLPWKTTNRYYQGILDNKAQPKAGKQMKTSHAMHQHQAQKHDRQREAPNIETDRQLHQNQRKTKIPKDGSLSKQDHYSKRQTPNTNNDRHKQQQQNQQHNHRNHRNSRDGRLPKPDQKGPIYFKGEQHPLSNLFPCTLVIAGTKYYSSEAAYQAGKVHCILQNETDKARREDLIRKIEAIATSRNPRFAMNEGQAVNTSNNTTWKKAKRQLMYTILQHKADQCKAYADYLKASSSRTLIEDTNHPYWGKGTNYTGLCMLGILHEKVRAEINK